MYHGPMGSTLEIKLNRMAKTSLAEQIRIGISGAIESGVLAPGARLPSWLDLAAQLGVARGTVKTAYERLADAQLIASSRSAGSRVTGRPVKRAVKEQRSVETDLQSALYQHFLPGPAVFQMGVPASDCFPAALFARIRARAARGEVEAPAFYHDPVASTSCDARLQPTWHCREVSSAVPRKSSSRQAFQVHWVPRCR